MRTAAITIIALTMLVLAVVVNTLASHHILQVSHESARAFRWLALMTLVILGLYRRHLSVWIFISMFIGAEVGASFPEVGKQLALLSQIFLRGIKSIIAPLLFATLVSGIAGHGNIKQVGRMGWKSLLYFELITTIALIIGLVAINLTQAGGSLHYTPLNDATAVARPAMQSWQDIVLHAFPENIAKAVAENQILQVVIYSLVFGIAVSLIDEEKRKTILRFTDALSEVKFKFTKLVMYLAPLGVGGAVAAAIGTQGFTVIGPLINLLFTLYGALIVFVLLVFLPIALIIKIPLKTFIQAISEPVSIAFATANSEAALPKAMEAMEGMGIPRRVVSFVMPMGYSFNLDGTTLYLSLATLFVAQAAGIHLSIVQQLTMVFVLMLTSKGVAGVSRAALVVLLATANSFGLPDGPIFMLLGIDIFMDMARTAVNVTGNCLATYVIAKWEKEI